MGKILIKQDIGFLEYPLWFQNSQVAEELDGGFLWEDRDGFVYRAGYKPPVRIDGIFLLYLLLKSQQEGWKERIELSRLELLNACGVGSGAYWYERLEESLERWVATKVRFEGTFYDGKAYQTMTFSIIHGWEIEKETKKLRVDFSPRWLQKIEHSNYFKMLDFEQFKALRSPLATRLYELLVKTFQGREEWEIDALKLAKKIPMQREYASQVVIKIQAAVNRINKHTDLQLALHIRKPKRGKAILCFRKLSEVGNQSQELLVMDLPEEFSGELAELFELLTPKLQSLKTVQTGICEALRKHGIEYARRNILYSNLHAKKNPRAYLLSALKKDWAASWWEEQSQQVKEHQPEEGEQKSQVREGFATDIKQQLAQAERKFAEYYPAEELELMQSFAAEKAQEILSSDDPQFQLQIDLQMLSWIETRLSQLSVS